MLQIETHTYINVYTYMYINACGISMWYVKYRYVSVCVGVCMHVCICIYIHTYISAYMYVCARPWCWRARTSTIQRHACQYVCMYTYTHVDVNISISKSSNVRNKWRFDKLKPYSHAPRLCVHVRTHTAFVHEDMDICRQERGDRLGTYAQYASYIHTCVLRV